MSPPADRIEFPLAKADLCVKCGLCLPHCPTYGETQDEAESPRGRIALMQGVVTGLVPHTPRLQTHLDTCLSCRSCERVCPAQVPYGELIDSGRAWLIRNHSGAPRLTRLLSPWLTRRRLRRLARVLMRLYQHSRLQSALRASGLLRGRLARLESLLPDTSARPRTAGSAALPDEGTPTLALFHGCVNDIVDADTLAAFRQVFAACGFRVEAPAAQTCCGALHQHSGLTTEAAALARRNVEAFQAAADSPVVYVASGCGASLQEYADPAFKARVREPHRLLLQHWPERLSLHPLKAKLAVHQPCTQRNVTGGGDAVLELLRRIPGTTVLPLDPHHHCCGAAGTYFLSQPAMADRLLEHKLDALAALAPDYLISSNIGCTLHLAAGLRRRGLTVPLLHPFALLARQWPSDR